MEKPFTFNCELRTNIQCNNIQEASNICNKCREIYNEGVSAGTMQKHRTKFRGTGLYGR